jgi:hypothetical protein
MAFLDEVKKLRRCPDCCGYLHRIGLGYLCPRCGYKDQLATTKTVMFNDNSGIVVKLETDPELRQESGWYVTRQFNKKTCYWRDYPGPGYGSTMWLRPEAAKMFELPVMEKQV